MAENDLGTNPAADPAAATLLDEQLNLKKRARRRLVGAIALALLAVIVLPMVMDQEPKPLTQDIQIRIPSQDSGSVSTLARMLPGMPAKPTPTPLPPPQTKPATSAPSAPVTPPATPAPAASTPSAAAPAAAGGDAKPESNPPAKPAGKTESPPAAATPAPAAAPSAAKPAEKPADKPMEKTSPQERKAEAVRATALLSGAQWEVQLGAYQDMANVRALQAKIKELGYPSFTEKVDTPQGARVRVRGGPFASREAAEKAQQRLKKLGAGAPLGGVVAQKAN